MAVLQYPIATEKALNLAEMQNTLIYVVSMSAAKKEIKEEFEKMFKVKVERVNTSVNPSNIKKAYIKLAKAYPASDIAKRLKLV